MSKILIYNLSDQADAKLKMLCRKMNIESRSVEKDEYGYPLSHILGIEDCEKKDADGFDEPMLYIAGLYGGMLNLFLDQLRRNKLIIPLKAIQTETNVAFTSSELYRELCAEREAFMQGRKAHKPAEE